MSSVFVELWASSCFLFLVSCCMMYALWTQFFHHFVTSNRDSKSEIASSAQEHGASRATKLRCMGCSCHVVFSQAKQARRSKALQPVCAPTTLTYTASCKKPIKTLEVWHQSSFSKNVLYRSLNPITVYSLCINMSGTVCNWKNSSSQKHPSIFNLGRLSSIKNGTNRNVLDNSRGSQYRSSCERV